MSNSKGQSNIGSIMNNPKSSLLPPKSPFPYIPSSSIVPRSLPKGEGVNSHHRRASSESFTVVEKPSWLDELLNEPEMPVRRGAHRRSSSDSFAYMNRNGGKIKKGPWKSPVDSSVAHRSVTLPNVDNVSSKADKKLLPAEKEDRVESSAKDPKISGEKKDFVRANSSETETRSARQQYARRWVQKLQYIAELRRDIRTLQARSAAIHAEIEICNQRNLILTMENEFLMQRLESFSHEQLIERFENEILDRDTQRLGILCREPQASSSSSHQRANNNDLDQEFANLGLNSNSQKKE